MTRVRTARRSRPAARQATLSRKAFLGQTLGITAAVSAWLAESGAPAADKDGPEIPLARHLQSRFTEEAQVSAQYAAFAGQARAEASRKPPSCSMPWWRPRTCTPNGCCG